MRATARYLGAAVLAAAAATASAQANELRFAIGVPANFTMVDAMRHFEAKIPERTNGALSARLYTGSSLLNFTETFPGVRDGVADMGYVVVPYHRAELRESNLLGDLGMIGTNIVVMAGAASEYCFTDAECRQEYLREGQVMLGFTSTANFRLISNTPIRTLDDLRGKRVRSYSAFGRWATDMGAIEVNLPAGDIYEGFSQGTIDANVHPYEAFTTLSLNDVAKYVTDINLGSLFVNALFNTNLDLWRSWDEPTRLAVMETAAEGIGRAVAATYAGDIAYEQNGVTELGVELINADDAMVEALAAFIQKDLPGIATLNESTFGVRGAEAKIARFMELVEKWEGLVGAIDATDPDQVGELYRTSLFGDIDKATYGM